jgi:hypothetical protein
MVDLTEPRRRSLDPDAAYQVARMGSCISSSRRNAISPKKRLGFLLACLRNLVFSPFQLGGLGFGRLVASDFLFRLPLGESLFFQLLHETLTHGVPSRGFVVIGMHVAFLCHE